MLNWIALISAALALPLSLSLSAEAQDVTQEQMADNLFHRGLLTKSQHTLLRSNEFLDVKCTGEKLSSCVPKINFVGGQCGLDEAPDEKTDMRPRPQGLHTQTLIELTDLVGTRVAQYPNALLAFGKLDKLAKRRLAELDDVYSTLRTIINSDGTMHDKIGRAMPLLRRADAVSAALAKSAGFEYEGGCGAGPEDSQMVKFVFSEKPKEAWIILQMEFDACKRVTGDPYNVHKCDSWKPIHSSAELSGNYRYLVLWSDGTTSEHRFSVLSTHAQRVEISK